MKHWGKHLILDVKHCSKFLINDEKHITNFVNDMLESIEMVKLAPLWIEFCETNDPAKRGISYVQVLQDSHSSCHFVSNTGEAYLDIFSCKEFETDKVIELFKEYFEPASINITIVYRDKDGSYVESSKNYF